MTVMSIFDCFFLFLKPEKGESSTSLGVNIRIVWTLIWRRIGPYISGQSGTV